MTDQSRRPEALDRYPFLTDKSWPVAESHGDQIVASQDEPDAVVHRYYRDNAGLRPLYYLPEPIERQIHDLQHRHALAYRDAFSHGPNGEEPQGITHGGPPWDADRGAVAIITGRPGERWPLYGAQTFASVMEIARNEVHCDLQLSGNLCTSLMQMSVRNRISGWNPIPTPFAYENLVIIGLICSDCWRRFRERYDLGECQTGQPFDPKD